MRVMLSLGGRRVTPVPARARLRGGRRGVLELACCLAVLACIAAGCERPARRLGSDRFVAARTVLGEASCVRTLVFVHEEYGGPGLGLGYSEHAAVIDVCERGRVKQYVAAIVDGAAYAGPDLAREGFCAAYHRVGKRHVMDIQFQCPGAAAYGLPEVWVFVFESGFSWDPYGYRVDTFRSETLARLLAEDLSEAPGLGRARDMLKRLGGAEGNEKPGMCP